MTVELAWTESGTGAPVVLLHAFPLDSRMWAHFHRRPLAFRLITPDLRGFGASPLGDDEPDLARMADDVVALMDRLDIPKALVGGVSMGGYVAQQLLRHYPDRLTGVMLIDTKGGADAPPASAARLAMADAIEASGSVDLLMEKVYPLLLGQTSRADRPAAMAEVADIVRSAPPASAAWAQRAMAARPDSFDVLRAAELPGLVVVGEEDTIAPRAEADAMAAAMTRGELAVVPWAGHLTPIETPTGFMAATQFFLRRFAA